MSFNLPQPNAASLREGAPSTEHQHQPIAQMAPSSPQSTDSLPPRSTKCTKHLAIQISTSKAQPAQRAVNITQSFFRFQDLPAELRDDICEEAIRQASHQLVFDYATIMSLLLSCKQLSFEARALCARNVWFLSTYGNLFCARRRLRFMIKDFPSIRGTIQFGPKPREPKITIRERNLINCLAPYATRATPGYRLLDAARSSALFTNPNGTPADRVHVFLNYVDLGPKYKDSLSMYWDNVEPSTQRIWSYEAYDYSWHVVVVALKTGRVKVIGDIGRVNGLWKDD